MLYTKKRLQRSLNKQYGADERNWTAVSTLARSRSTIELHPHKWRSGRDLNSRSPPWQGGMLTPTPPDHFSGEEGGIWTLAPIARPIPLAGAPLQPLEYFFSNQLCPYLKWYVLSLSAYIYYHDIFSNATIFLKNFKKNFSPLKNFLERLRSFSTIDNFSNH